MIRKPDMLRTLRGVFILIRIIISILEEEYQSINRLASEKSAAVQMTRRRGIRKVQQRLVIESEDLLDLDIFDTILPQNVAE